jgi:hypothetical protein
MKTCIYCGEEKNPYEFSDEHIWPDALGGDDLPDFWRTDDVCQKCNNLSGLYVDGAFVKGWPGEPSVLRVRSSTCPSMTREGRCCL